MTGSRIEKPAVPTVCNGCGFWLGLEGILHRSSSAKQYPCERCLHGDPSDIDGPQDDEWINEAYYRQHPKESQ